MPFKFENLDVWKMSLDYCDSVYQLADLLPESERFNLKSQIIRAATSISLNIAEGSTSQSDPEQSRFLSIALRSLIETVACQRLIIRRKYVDNNTLIDNLDLQAQELARRLHSFRHSLASSSKTLREEQPPYGGKEI